MVTKPTSGLCAPNLLLDFAISTLGFRWAFGEYQNGFGEAFAGMITTLFRGHPEQYINITTP